MGCLFSRRLDASSINESKSLLADNYNNNLYHQQLSSNHSTDHYQQRTAQSSPIIHSRMLNAPLPAPSAVSLTPTATSGIITTTTTGGGAGGHNNSHDESIIAGLKITSPPHVNNLENSLRLYRNTKAFDKMDGYKDLYTEVDYPVAELSEHIVEGLAQRTRVSLDKARLSILENKMIVRDAFSQILTEKIQLIMDETGEDIHRARKVLCEQNNDENRAIAYCKHIRMLMESGDVDRRTALFVYYNFDRDVELAKKELILQRFMRDQKHIYNNFLTREEAMRLLSESGSLDGVEHYDTTTIVI